MRNIKEEIKKLKRRILSEDLTQAEIRVLNYKIKQLESKLDITGSI